MRKYLSAITLFLLITPCVFCAVTPEAELAARVQTAVTHAESTASSMLRKPYLPVDFSSRVFINFAKEEAAVYQIILNNKNNTAFLNAVERELTISAVPNKFKAQLYLQEVVKAAQNNAGPVRVFNFVSGHEAFTKRMAEELLVKGRLSFNSLIVKIEKRLMVSREKALLLALSAETHYAKAVVEAASTAEYRAAKRLVAGKYFASKGGRINAQANLNLQKTLRTHFSNLKTLRKTSLSRVSSLNYALSKKDLTQITMAIEKHPSLQASFAGLAGRSYFERAAFKIGRAVPAAAAIIIIARLVMPEAEDIKKAFRQSVQSSTRQKATEQQQLAEVINNHPELVVLAASGSEYNLKSIIELLNSRDGFIKHSLGEILNHISEGAASAQMILEDEDLLNDYLASLKSVNADIQEEIKADNKRNLIKELKVLNNKNSDMTLPNDNIKVRMPEMILIR